MRALKGCIKKALLVHCLPPEPANKCLPAVPIMPDDSPRRRGGKGGDTSRNGVGGGSRKGFKASIASSRFRVVSSSTIVFLKA